jgi:uncharacterized membrane protein
VLDTLFNVHPAQLVGARLETAWPPGVVAVVALVAVLGALALGGYRWRQGLGAPGVLRAVLALLLVLALARPVATVDVPDAAAGPVAVLIDDTASMAVADAPAGQARGSWVDAAFAPGEGTLLAALEARFDVRLLRYDGRARATVPGPGAYRGAVSDPLGALLDTVGPQGNGLSAVVLVSDGGQLPATDVVDALTRLAAAGVPVHAIGVGSAAPSPDVAVTALEVPAAVLVGDSVDLRLEVVGAGHDGQTVRVEVRDNGVLRAERRLHLSGDPARVATRVPVRFQEPGLRRITLRAAAQDTRDVAPGNDAAERLVDVRPGPVRVLHVEGEPRFEVKFLRRALAGDRALRLSSLVRTGDNRFLRLGIEDEDELADGFPVEAAPLFRYHVLVLGSMEAAAFAPAQLALLEDFVARRGGSLLLLGGRMALAEGGFGDTPLADMLPVRLGPPAPAFRVAARARLTDAGRGHPVTRGLDQVPRALPLPALAVVNPVRHLKPGASALLEGVVDGEPSAPPLALLSHHRYGRGRVAVMPVRDSWRWRMHADVALDDRAHELLWRRLLRWLAREVPDAVTVSVSPRLAAPGQTAVVRAVVRDAQWQVRDTARAVMVHSTPLGDIERDPLAFEPGPEGAFAGSVTPGEGGRHEIAVEASLPDGARVRARTGVLVTEAAEEFRAVGLDAALLERIAGRTGGSYRAAAQADGLAERVAATAPAGERRERVALWNAPVLLLVLLALACGEWWLRRRGRLA